LKQDPYKQLSLERIEEPRESQGPKEYPDADRSGNSNISESKTTSIKQQLNFRNSLQSNVVSLNIAPAMQPDTADKLARFNECFVDTPKSSFVELLGKCQTLLEQKKRAKLLSLENRYAKNNFSERTYLQLQAKA
jgi:hypothetical protein